MRQSGGTNRVVVLARDGASILRVLLTTAAMTLGFDSLAVSCSGVVAGADAHQQRLVVSSSGGERNIPSTQWRWGRPWATWMARRLTRVSGCGRATAQP